MSVIGDLEYGYDDLAVRSVGGVAPVAPAAGKRTLTQGLAPRTLLLRMVDGAGRDGNGVTAGAEGAVDRAAGAGGEPLRADVRAQFESSLGADLSAVRVHRSADSAVASEAVGARAYTVGNDIHFAAGQYQPDDPFGLHLIAHEVAHTQQQAGGATRPQYKLEVSAPGDAAEVEADRAADAMVRGAPTAVGTGAPRVARVKELTEAADRGETAMGAAIETPTRETRGMRATNVEDRASAATLYNIIQGESANVKEGIATEQVEPIVATTNANCTALLTAYLENADAQGGQISTFLGLYGRAMKDYGRLELMSNSYDAFSLNDMTDDKSAAKRGTSFITGLFEGDDPVKELGKVEALDSEVATSIEKMKVRKKGLTSQGKLIIGKSNAVANGLATMANRQRAFLAKSNAVLTPAAQQQLQDAKTRAQKDYTEAAGSVIKDALIGGASGFAEGGPVGAAAGAAQGAGSGLWAQLIKPKLDQALKEADMSVGKFPDNSAAADRLTAELAAWDELNTIAAQINTKRDEIRQAGDALGNQVDLYEQERALYELDMIQLGQHMDKLTRQSQLANRKPPKKSIICDPNAKPEPVPAAKGPRFETLMQFLAEADRYIAQCNVAVAQGETELKVSDATDNSASRAHRALVDVTTDKHPSCYYLVNRKTVTRGNGTTWDKLTAVRQTFTLHNGLNPGGTLGGQDEVHQLGSAEGTAGWGANALIANQIKTLTERRDRVVTMRAAMSNQLGL